jgi:hypothetical protein
LSLAATIRAMAAAGCSVEQIAAVSAQFEEAEKAAIAERRAKDAARKRRSRAITSALSRGRDVTPRDAADIVGHPVTSRDADPSRVDDTTTHAPGFPVGFSNENPSLVNPLPSEGTPTPEAAGHGDQTEPGRKPRREAASAGDEPDDPKARKPIDILAECVSRQTAADIVEHRKKLRKPLTARAAAENAKALVECGNPEAGAAMWIALGWQGFRVDWFRNEQAKSNARAGPHKPAKRNPFLADFERELSEQHGHAADWGYHKTTDEPGKAPGKTVDLLDDEYGSAD